MSASTAPPPNFSRPLSSASHPQGLTGHSLRSASSSNPSASSSSAASSSQPPPPLPTDAFFNPSDSLIPEASTSASGSAPPSSPHVSRARQSKTAGTTGLGIGRPEKEKPRGGGFGPPGTGTAARGPSRKRSRVDLAGEAKEEREREAGAGRLVPQDEKAGFDNAIEFDPDNDGEDDDDDDEGGGKKSRTASGAASARRKIQISYIEDKARRHITFSKRKAGIMKKAFELSTLTGTQVLLLVVSETGLVYTFTTSKLQPLVTKEEGKNLIQACLNAPNGQDPDGSPAGAGGMTGGPSIKAGGPRQYKEDLYSSYPPDPSHYSHISIPPVPELPDSPESEDPVTPTNTTSGGRRPSAVLPRRGRTVSVVAPKSKKAQQTNAEAAALANQHLENGDELTDVERAILEADKKEELRLRGMEFGGGDDDDADEQDVGGLEGVGMGMGRAVSGMHGITATPRIASHANGHVSSLYSTSLPQSNLGGIGQYDDYSAHELLPSKLEGEDDEQMQHYLSASAVASSVVSAPSPLGRLHSSSSSGLSGDSSLHPHHQQHQQQPMSYAPYTSHLNYGGGNGYSPRPNDPLSSTPTGYDAYSGSPFGGQGGAGW